MLTNGDYIRQYPKFCYGKTNGHDKIKGFASRCNKLKYR